MATPQEKLAQALKALKNIQKDKDIAIIKAADMSDTNKKLLKANGFIKEVLKGWYISCRPDERAGDTTSWYMSFWDFVATYLNSRFGDKWCLSPEQSLLLHGGNRVIQPQLLVRSPKANNNIVQLLHGTTVLDNKLEIPEMPQRISLDGLQIYSLEYGLISVGNDFFTRHPTDARACLSMMKGASGLLEILLDGGHSVISGRLAGAFRNIGNNKIADTIVKTMRSAGYEVREKDPFGEKVTGILSARETSPYANRIKLMWYQMRNNVLEYFPALKEMPVDIEAYIKDVEDIYTEDAYHSLSIEGYRVTTGLIEKVREGNWNPQVNKADMEARNALAARGYYQAFLVVLDSIRRILKGENSGEVADNDHSDWYRELFAPSVTAGILKASDLAGYRNSQVYIKGSKHTPLNPEAVRDAMPVFFDLLKEETEASVRAVLGHFMFVYIHPYMDGNGRIGRFLFNTMLASGGYPWTVIPIGKRDAYMGALEKASVDNDITLFVQFISRLINENTIK